MKKKLNLFAIVFCILLVYSCQKQPNEVLDPVTNNNRVKTYTEAVTSPNGNYSSTYDISYDNSGRVTSMISAASPGDKFVYSYPSASLYKMDVYNAGMLSIHEDFFLNASFLPDSTLQYNDTKDTLTEGYTYNANKELTRLRQYDYTKATGAVPFNTTTYTYAADGTLSKSQDTDGEMHTYEYYPNLVYAPPLTVGPVTITSTRKLNLVKTHTVTSNGSLVGSATFTYVFDVKNRISTEKAVISDGSTILKTYTYF